MLLKTYLDVPVNLDSFKATFSWEPERCFGGLGERAREEGERLLAEAGVTELATGAHGDDPGRPIARLHLGEVQAQEHLISVPLELEVDGPGGFPSLEGTIDAAWLGPARAYLSLSLHYEMASDLLESVSQRTVFHRVVEVVMQHFLVNVAECLCVSCAGHPVPAALRADSTD